ncbi:MAG: tyrosine-type recombinase/integrase, partial [Planctomycetota bacterium]
MARQPTPWYRTARKRWYVTIDGTTHNLGPDKEEAFERFHSIMASPIKPGKISVFVLMNEFLEWVENHRKPDTYTFYKKRIDRWVKDNKDMDSTALRPFHVQKWLDKKDWGPTYKAGVVTTLKTCFNWGVKQGYLSSSPIRFLEKPKPARRETPVTKEEYQTILSLVSESDPFHDLVVFCWETGCRPQTTLRFTANDVDIKNSRIVVENPKAKGPKWRVVHLNKKALAIVKKHLKDQPGPVFTNSQGKPWTTNACSNRFDRLKGKVGRTVSLYDFRHAYGTDMLMAGVDVAVVAELMGHTDTKMLMEIYQQMEKKPALMNSQA